MNNESLCVFLPVRKGCTRIPNKNTRPFAGFNNGLLELKLNQLVFFDEADEIIVSTNDPKCIEIAESFQKTTSKIIIDLRTDHLCSDTTKLSELLYYVPKITECSYILWTHVTSPFIDSVDYSNAIKQYQAELKNGYDSLMSVLPMKTFLWSDEQKDIINRKKSEKWPRTQDLSELYEVDSGIFLTSREIFLSQQDRIGKNPFLFINNKLKSFDIDWEIDFLIAEAIYMQMISQADK
jgi:N-acylneuraminate cytidylyltransferase